MTERKNILYDSYERKDEDILLNGSNELKAINLDINYPGLEISVDYLHIHKQNPSEEFSLHAHPNFELHYIAEGEGEIGFVDESMISSTEIIEFPAIVKSSSTPKIKEYHLNHLREQEIIKNTKVFKLRKGDAFINPPGQFCWHKSSQHNPIVEYGLRFSITIKDINSPNDKYFNKEYKIIKQLISENLIQITNNNNEIETIFQTIFKEANNKLPGFILKIKNELLNLIILFARQSWDRNKISSFVPKADVKNKRLGMLDDFINSNIGTAIKINQISKYLFMSDRNLCRFVKENKGISIHQYVLQIRINKAVDLCRNSEYTFLEIAYITGFSNSSHLSKVIKQYTGKSPSEL